MPFIGDLPPDHELLAGRPPIYAGDDFLQHQVEEGLDSPLRVDSPEPEELSEEDSGDDNDDIEALTDMLNDEGDEENGAGASSAEQLASSPSKKGRGRGRPSMGASASAKKKTPKSAVKSAAKSAGGRGRPRGGGVPRPAKIPTKGSRSSARVQEIAERPAPEEFAAPAKGKKRGRPSSGASASVGRPAKKIKTSAIGGGKQPEYEVEKIVDATIDPDTMEHLYRVKWKGYGAGDSTWEPKENLAGCIDMVHEFDKVHGKAVAKERAEERKKARAEAAEARGEAKKRREEEKAKKAAEPPKVPGKRGRKPKGSKGRGRGRPKAKA